MKKLLSGLLCAVLAAALSVNAFAAVWPVVPDVGSAETNTSETESNYSPYWQYWCQGASKYNKVRHGGCRVVAQAKLLVECGAAPADSGLFNPDLFLEWAMPLGYWPADAYGIAEQTSGSGAAAIAYAEKAGIKLTQDYVPLSGGNSAEDAETVMRYIRDGHYVVLHAVSHQAYVGSAASLAAGTPIILDSWGSCSYHPASCCEYRGYTDFYFSGFYCYAAEGSPVPINGSAVDETPRPVDHGKDGVHFEKAASGDLGRFTDVSPDDWFAGSVSEAVAMGLMKGVSDSAFDPYGSVTVAQAVAMAARIHSIYTVGTENFDQSSGGAWYQGYFDYAYNNGVISRAVYNGDATKAATRARFAEIFANSLPAAALAEINAIADDAIPDVRMSDSFAQPVYQLYRAGVLTGGEGGAFSPGSGITRAESAAIVSRMAESNNRKSFSLG